MFLDSAGENSDREQRGMTSLYSVDAWSPLFPPRNIGLFKKIITVRAILLRFFILVQIFPCDGDQVVKHYTKDFKDNKDNWF